MLEPEQTDETIVRFENVSMHYGQDANILKDIHLDLPRGSFHFLTGASGAGKTSLLKLMYLGMKPSSGQISLFGQETNSLPRQNLAKLRRRIGIVFQEFHLLNHLTAFENVALPLILMGQKPKSYESDVTELLYWVGLGGKLRALPPTLSGGEKQRLSLARAVVGKPDILLADEPTGNLDQAMALRILKLLSELHRMGTTMVIASHDQAMIDQAGRPVLYLENGSLTLKPSETAPQEIVTSFSQMPQEPSSGNIDKADMAAPSGHSHVF